MGRAIDLSEAILGREHVVRLGKPPMTADDFALYADCGPTLYLKLGVASEGATASLHSGGFDVDERCIGTGIAVLAALARDVLGAADRQTHASPSLPRRHWADDHQELRPDGGCLRPRGSWV